MKILLELSAIILLMMGTVSVENTREQNKIENLESSIVQVEPENFNQEMEEEKFIIEEISDSNDAYDLTDENVLKELSDLIIIGKIGKIEKVSNYVEKNDSYAATRTYALIDDIRVLYQKEGKKEEKILENRNQAETQDMLVAFYGGTISYHEYEKSLKEAQKEKRALLWKIGENGRIKENTYIKSRGRNQIEIEEGKEYLMYLVYSEDYEMFIPVSTEYGVMEYDSFSKSVRNHIKGNIEKKKILFRDLMIMSV